ncbi:response regulator [Flaviaesturariibacter flavus]|uniref:Response regulator n=1 Tax=Flaviaesturariibacter flavus TaxID=2502780 RepID=A0A4R1BAJ1_9BACT|nr:response regulator [Flaviaesturariibacter flavus]TCJ13963.1 response regulator [Flaviaesturariibacter flavus]
MQSTFHIFHADDDPEDRWLFEDVLKQCDPGVRLTQFEDGDYLLRHLQSGAPEFGTTPIVVCDMQMPLAGGAMVLRSIRNIKGWEKTPVIIFTTSSFYEDVRFCLQEGALAFFTKPNTVMECVNVARKMLDCCAACRPIGA